MIPRLIIKDPVLFWQIGVLTLIDSYVYSRAAPNTGISIRPVPAFFGGIRINKACNTSTNSVVGVSYLL